MTNELDAMPIGQLQQLDSELLQDLQHPDAMSIFGATEMEAKSRLRVELAAEVLRRNGHDPAADHNSRLRNDTALPEPPAAVEDRRVTPETIELLRREAMTLPEDSVTRAAVLKRVELDEELLAKETAISDTEQEAADE